MKPHINKLEEIEPMAIDTQNIPEAFTIVALKINELCRTVNILLEQGEGKRVGFDWLMLVMKISKI